ncbi:MAG: hypothetical protein ABSF51_07610 [Verrucomicrobiota bacterium]
MVPGLDHPTLCRWFGSLSLGYIFLLLGGPLAHADDYVYVSNTGAGTITQIGPDGNTSTFASGLDSPEGLAFDSAGNLFVADAGDGTISEISSSANMSTFVSGLNSPAALAFDPGGNLYVETLGDQTISKIDSGGNVSIFATGISSYYRDGAYLATDNEGNVYANTAHTMEKFDSNGNPSTVAGGGIDGNFYEGMALDGNGNLCLALQNAGSVDCFGGTGSLLTGPQYYPAPYNNDIDLALFEDTPCDLAFDANGNLFAYFAQMVYGGTNGIVSNSGVVIEFGANGQNSVIATGIAGGTGDNGYIAVEMVPEPGIWTFVAGLAAVVCLRRRSNRRAPTTASRPLL